MRVTILGLLGCFLACGAQAAPAATTASAIVAVVNNEAITGYDLNARTRFVLATTGISDAPESLARLKPQIFRALVDERLQLQEAGRNQIEVTDREVEQAIAAIENQRGMPPGAIADMLAENRIPPETFQQQVRAQIAWGKLLQRKVRSQIRISEEEIAQMTRKLSTPVVKQEFKISILQLPVDKPARDGEVRVAAEKMVLEARGGANFEEMARQFSGSGAREGGKLSAFWVQPDELDPIIANALKGAKAGFISAPLKNAIGYTIIRVYETRDLPGQAPTGTEIVFREILLKLRSSASEKEVDALENIAEDIAKHPGTCEDKSIAGIANAELAAIEVKRTTQMLSDLPAALRVIATGMKVGDISAPLASDDGIHLYMLCGRRDGVTVIVDKGRATSAAYQQRMELEAQKYMRNLRRDAFIEVRNPS